MLKLLRIEDTNVFAIVEEEKFNKYLEVDGYTRIEETAAKDFVVNLSMQEHSWFGEVQKLREEKRAELYKNEGNEKKVYIDLKTILIHYFNESNKFHVVVRKIVNLANHMYNALRDRILLDNYDISLDMFAESVERILQYNRDIFATDSDTEITFDSWIYFKLSVEDAEALAKLHPLDEIVLDIIREFIQKHK